MNQRSDIFHKKTIEFISEHTAFRERVLDACVACGYTDVKVRPWAHAMLGNKHYPNEVIWSGMVIARIWVEHDSEKHTLQIMADAAPEIIAAMSQ